MNDFNEPFVSSISRKLIKSPKFYYTSLEGIRRVKKSQNYLGESPDLFDKIDDILDFSDRNYKVSTIGDDIELMYTQLEKYKNYGFYKSKNLSTFLELDDSFTEIECKRKSYAKKARRKENVQWFGFIFVILVVAFFGILFSYIETLSKTLSFKNHRLTKKLLLRAGIALGIILAVIFPITCFNYIRKTRLSNFNTASIWFCILFILFFILPLIFYLDLKARDQEILSNASFYLSYVITFAD